MKSVAFDHFPRVVAGPNRFWLYNPILQKRYENRPEERVRLKWIEYILLQTDWKKSRVGFELPVKLRQSKNTLRADLVLYTDAMKPAALVECKSDSVNLNNSVAVQAARYNSEVNAQYLVLTNGIEDYWFQKSEGMIKISDNFFDERISFKSLDRKSEYWQQRGFCSAQSNSEMNGWVTAALDAFWSDETFGTRKFLDFQKTVLPVPMNHYYKVFEIDSEKRLAVTFIGTGSSDSFIIGILNSKGSNQGILSLNLDKMGENENEMITIFKGSNKTAITPEGDLPFTPDSFDPESFKNLPQILMKFFD